MNKIQPKLRRKKKKKKKKSYLQDVKRGINRFCAGYNTSTKRDETSEAENES